MGYEVPVEMPSMGVYNTDLMKMYIAGVKDQYEKGQEEMKDFMKLYGDFYSDIPGATQAYNDLTLGGARDMINQMYAAGIDPYKSPEARAAISRYIASRPTGLLNEMKRSAENAKEYKKNRDKLIMAGQFDPEFERFMLGGKSLEEWDPNTPFTATTPHTKQDWETFATPYFKNFKAQEDLGESRPGYRLYGTRPEEIERAINAAIDDLQNSPWGRYQAYKADQVVANMVDENGLPLSAEQKTAKKDEILREHLKDAATHYFQPEEKDDKLAQGIILDDRRTANDIKADRAKQALQHYYHDLEFYTEHPEYDPNSPFYMGEVDVNGKAITTPGSSKGATKNGGKKEDGKDNWFKGVWKDAFFHTKGSSLTFDNGQVKGLWNFIKNQPNSKITREAATQYLDKIAVGVPGYTLSKVTGTNYISGTKSIKLTAGDEKRLYSPERILGRMYGTAGGNQFHIEGVKNMGSANNKKDREDIAAAIRNRHTSTDYVSMQQKDTMIFYKNHDGKIRIMMPVIVSNIQDGDNFSKEMIYDTGITGTMNEKGGFIPDAHCEDKLKRLNEVMTKAGAPVSKTDPSVYND